MLLWIVSISLLGSLGTIAFFRFGH